MKNSTKFLLALGAMATLGSSAFAQRKCDLGISITAPAANTVVAYNDTLFISFDIKNNGPDAIEVGDTIFYSAAGRVFNVVPTGNIASGATVAYPKQLSLTNNTTADQTLELCLTLMSQEDIVYINVVAPGDTVRTKAAVTYTDAVETNNESCVSFTFKAKSVSILNVNDGAKEELSLYPNPATTQVSFNMNLDKAENVTASVKDITGREVLRQDFGKVQAGNTAAFNINVASLNAGLYIIELNAGSRKAVGKVTVSH